MQMQSSGINPVWCHAGSCTSQFGRLCVHARRLFENKKKIGRKEGMQTRTIRRIAVNANITGDIDREFFARANLEITRIRVEIKRFALARVEKKNLFPSSISSSSSRSKRAPVIIKGTKQLFVQTETRHNEAVTINKWRRCFRSNEIPIQADIWFYKNTNKIRLFTSGIGNSTMRDVTVRDIFPTRDITLCRFDVELSYGPHVPVRIPFYFFELSSLASYELQHAQTGRL